MNTNSTDFAQLVTGFLTDFLPLQRNYSRNTVLSYKDALKLFAVFLTEYKKIRLADFTMQSFDRVLIIEYLKWLRNRGCSVSTANQRLAAIKSFSEYAGVQCLECLAEKGLRHRVILTLLYDSGCRVQELCDMAIRDIQTGDNPTVRLHGKGNKYRTVAIARNTAKLVSEYIKRQRRTVSADRPLVVNQKQAKLSRDGVNYIIRKYVHEIQRKDSSFPEIHAHGFRHSKAMHMLEAGINIVYIRDFLGHEDISTTMVYIRADNRLKTEAVNKLAPKVTGETEFPDWTKDTDLMSFLNSFK